MKNKKNNEFAGLEALPTDYMDKTVAGLREGSEGLRRRLEVGKIDPPHGIESWAEAVRQLEISGMIFRGPYAKVVFKSPRKPFEREQLFQDFSIGEVLHQAQLEIMQGRQDMASAARDSGLTASEILYLRHLVKGEPHARFAELVGKLDELFENMEKGGGDA